jgi:PIN domain nuclease of toxin-antitoxin system
LRDFVLDASALLALLHKESGAGRVAEVLPGALLGMVNCAEVVTKLADLGMPAGDAREAIISLGVRIAPFTEEQAVLTGGLRPITRSAGLSLGDRACLALGKVMDGTILTAERSWAQFAAAAEVRVELIRG